MCRRKKKAAPVLRTQEKPMPIQIEVNGVTIAKGNAVDAPEKLIHQVVLEATHGMSEDKQV